MDYDKIVVCDGGLHTSNYPTTYKCGKNGSAPM